MKSNLSRGRVSQTGEGLGTVTEEMVVQRAREIAEINGREPNEYTQDDLELARQELTGTAPEGSTAGFDSSPNLKEWEKDPTQSGDRGVTKRPYDPEGLNEKIVTEGVAEADHEHMLEGSRSSKKADQV